MAFFLPPFSLSLSLSLSLSPSLALVVVIVEVFDGCLVDQCRAVRPVVHACSPAASPSSPQPSPPPPSSHGAAEHAQQRQPVTAPQLTGGAHAAKLTGAARAPAAAISTASSSGMAPGPACLQARAMPARRRPPVYHSDEEEEEEEDGSFLWGRDPNCRTVMTTPRAACSVAAVCAAPAAAAARRGLAMTPVYTVARPPGAPPPPGPPAPPKFSGGRTKNFVRGLSGNKTFLAFTSWRAARAVGAGPRGGRGAAGLPWRLPSSPCVWHAS